MGRAVRLAVKGEIRQATLGDLPALATWSGQVNDAFRPAVESGDSVLLVALANGRFPIGHVLVDLRGILSHLLVLAGFSGPARRRTELRQPHGRAGERRRDSAVRAVWLCPDE